MRQIIYPLVALLMASPIVFTQGCCSSDKAIAKKEIKRVKDPDVQEALMQFQDLGRIPAASKKRMSEKELNVFTRLSNIYHVSYAFLDSKAYKANKADFLKGLERTFLTGNDVESHRGEYLVFYASDKDIEAQQMMNPATIPGNIVLYKVKNEGFQADETMAYVNTYFSFVVYNAGRERVYSITELLSHKMPDPTKCNFNVTYTPSTAQARRRMTSPFFSVNTTEGQVIWSRTQTQELVKEHVPAVCHPISLESHMTKGDTLLLIGSLI